MKLTPIEIERGTKWITQQVEEQRALWSGGHVRWRKDWWSLCVKVKRFDRSDLVKLKRLNIYDFAISKTSYASTYEISSW